MLVGVACDLLGLSLALLLQESVNLDRSLDLSRGPFGKCGEHGPVQGALR